MRRRSTVLGLVAACVVVVVPSSSAGAAGAQCSLVLPAKVSVDSRTERVPYRLSSNCAANGAAYAWWDVENAGGSGWSLLVSRADVAAGRTSGTLTLRDTAKRGVYTGHAYSARTADGTPVTQNTPTMRVKSACRVSLSGSRSTLRDGGYTITTTGKIWSGATHSWAKRAGVWADLLKRRSDGTWALAGRSLVATGLFFPKGAKKGDQFRVVVDETAATWACGSAVHTVRS